MRLRRSELSTPGSNAYMMRKAAASQSDLVLLDLEDAVSPDAKAEARTQVIQALTTLDWGTKSRAVRINNLESEYAYQDIITVVEEAGEQLDILILPKIRAARDVWWVDVLLTQIEQRLRRTHPIKLEAFIEEVEAMLHVEEIARASSRLEALIFGPGDYSASQGIDSRGIDGSFAIYPDTWYYARNQIVIAARAAGIDAIDGAYSNFKDPEGYQRECLRARALGFVGKWAIHPSQIEIANQVFSPTPEEVAEARKIDGAYREAQVHGIGAIAVDGKMVDAAIARSIQNTIQRADLLGM
ncbi:HpcH/HpaI aldolase/citrate lyase family protein [Ktedonospora formicarum]|uniref:Malyl-CoA lyase n=1 Tax=Ktedonospora formicarum TaxID=2778364 RepID=A0A8J3HY32_9CHLR|nr:CoA ester lyase [Ktedonospora formicarum]GHO43230.1 malyl-CoA lyase [Ktedonospora formicarum]